MKYQSKFGRTPITAIQIVPEGNEVHVLNGVACAVLDKGTPRQMVVPIGNWLITQGPIRYDLNDDTFKSSFTKMEFEDAVPKEG